MKIEGSIALVTGANRGLGAAFCRTLLDRGATKVYAAARDLQRLDHDGVVPVELDVAHVGDRVRRRGDRSVSVQHRRRRPDQRREFSTEGQTQSRPSTREDHYRNVLKQLE